MIFGHVLDSTPHVRLTLPGLSSPVSIDFVVDTGYDGELAIPANLVDRLDSTYIAARPIELADGSVVAARRYIMALDCDGDERDVLVTTLRGGTPLIGTGLLADSFVTLDFAPGGEVTIEAH